MKALVLGGTRFFGKRLVSALLERGVEVTLLTRGQRPDDFGKQVRRIKMDRKQLDHKDPILAAESWDIVYDQICFDAKEAVAACRFFRDKTKHYAFTSTMSVYKPGADIRESNFDPFAYRYSATVTQEEDYGEAKRQAEATFFQKSEFPVTAARFPIVLGEDDYTERLKFHVKRIELGAPIHFPNLDAKLSFIHAQDAAEFLASLTERRTEGPVNCCSFEPIALRELIARIEKATGKKAVIADSGEPSPFGVESDFWMNTEKLRTLRFEPRDILEWLPGLIEHLRGA